MSTMSVVLSRLAQFVEEKSYGFVELPLSHAARYKQGYDKLKTEMAIASTTMLGSDDPMFGKGLLIYHESRIVEDPTTKQTGLEVLKRDTEQPTPSILILESAIYGTDITTTRFTYSGVLKARDRLAARIDLPAPIADNIEWTAVAKQPDGSVKIFRQTQPSALTNESLSPIIHP